MQTVYRIEVDGKGVAHLWAEPSLWNVMSSLQSAWQRLKVPQGDFIGVACAFSESWATA